MARRAQASGPRVNGPMANSRARSITQGMHAKEETESLGNKGKKEAAAQSLRGNPDQSSRALQQGRVSQSGQCQPSYGSGGSRAPCVLGSIGDVEPAVRNEGRVKEAVHARRPEKAVRPPGKLRPFSLGVADANPYEGVGFRQGRVRRRLEA